MTVLVSVIAIAQTACLEEFSEPRGADAGAGGRVPGGASGGGGAGGKTVGTGGTAGATAGATGGGAGGRGAAAAGNGGRAGGGATGGTAGATGGSAGATGGSGGKAGGGAGATGGSGGKAGGGAGQASACGNGVLDSGEGCDGTLFGERTCTSEVGKAASGNLKCNGSCQIDTSSCSYCGDGKRNLTEECDGADLGFASCKNRLGVGSTGVLACSGTCVLDDSNCTRPVCGDGAVNGFESCDGTVFSADATCAKLVGGQSTGTPTCSAGCAASGSSCSPACHPLTQVGCKADHACTMTTLNETFQIYCLAEPFIAPPPVAACGSCGPVSPFFGPACERGTYCLKTAPPNASPFYTCTQVCQNNTDCSKGGVCDLKQGVKGFGLCVSAIGKSEPPCGAAGAGG